MPTPKTKKAAAPKKAKDAKPAPKKTVKKPAAEAEKPKAKKEIEAKPEQLKALEKIDHEEAVTSQAAKGGSFIPTVGRRKTSIARVRLIKNGKGEITVNGKPFDKYFTTYDLRDQVTSPLKITGQETAVDVSVKAEGGGIRGQAEATRLGLSRALILLNPTFRTTLKKLGYLTRDSRKRERKKFGLKSARRAPQWSKR
jgi:small subunit ribosomal protein S9